MWLPPVRHGDGRPSPESATRRRLRLESQLSAFEAWATTERLRIANTAAAIAMWGVR